eukprot:4249821-Pyramimonas_sp.AAC.1
MVRDAGPCQYHSDKRTPRACTARCPTLPAPMACEHHSLRVSSSEFLRAPPRPAIANTQDKSTRGVALR